VNLGSLDGKARLAERARPLIGQIPDGAFRDLMLGELDRIANVKLRVDSPATPRKSASRPQERTLVRSAVGLLVQHPAFAEALQPPWLFATLRQPGIALLAELIALCRERPTMSTAVLLEHYEGREEARALQKLATLDFPGEDDALHAEFIDAIRQLDRQTVQQRLAELDAKVAEHGLSALSAEEKSELRDLQKQLSAGTNP
jgi:DNA primase